MKPIHVFFVCGIFLQTLCLGQTRPEDFGFTHKYIILHTDTIPYYLYGKGAVVQQKKPLLLYLQGSGQTPIYTLQTDGKKSSSLLVSPQLVSQYQYVVIGKPGVPFAGPKGKSVPKDEKRLTLDYRIQAADAVIQDLIRANLVDASRIVLVGHSEGGQIAPAIARINKHVTHMACLSGTGINQMYDFLTHIRQQVKEKKLSGSQANIQIDSLFWYYKDILTYPASTEKKWAGDTYLRWASRIRNPPLTSMLQLNIPMYVAIGTVDQATTLENMDMIPIEFIKAGKTNLTYKWYWNYDHTYTEVIVKEDGTSEVKSHVKEVLNDLLHWLNSH